MIWLHDWRDRVADGDINDVAIFAPKMNKGFLKLCDLGFRVNTPLTKQQISHLPGLFQTIEGGITSIMSGHASNFSSQN